MISSNNEVKDATFTESEAKQITKRGSSIDEVREQLRRFVKGCDPLHVSAPATPENGIQQLSEHQIVEFQQHYIAKSKAYSIVKFVPASGAASRMFKHLHEYKQQAIEGVASSGDSKVSEFFSQIHRFPFYNDLVKMASDEGYELQEMLESGMHARVIEYILEAEGLNYGTYPKGLVQFHVYDNDKRTAFEEHLIEAANYAVNADKAARVHFTIPNDRLGEIMQHISHRTPELEERFGIRFAIEFTAQKSSTDTIAVHPDNTPFKVNGHLLFRPGGHGALIENLNDIDGDVVFIKNIDNVLPEYKSDLMLQWKQVLGGYFLQLQGQIFKYIEQLDSLAKAGRLDEVLDFIEQSLCIKLTDAHRSLKGEELWAFIFNKLNRPLRICGMVKNEGEPGGGPFWVDNADGTSSLQIVEKAQIDLNDASQQKMLEGSTHFNPVDLVVGMKDFMAQRFDLLKYVDADASFIANKTKDGKELKALERPGLWNGAMADWNTVLVEVPASTFNPVKIINDLLREAHQPNK